jgi:subtilisin family serine protease
MNSLRPVTHILILTIAALILLVPGADAAKDADFIPGEIMIKFKADTQLSARNSVLSRIDATPVMKIRGLGWELVKVEIGTASDAIALIKNDPNVEDIGRNGRVYALETPNDVNFTGQWHLNNTGQYSGTSGADISAVNAWNYIKESPTIVIGSLDTGIDTAHIDLSGQIWTNPGELWNGADDDSNGYVDDVHGYDFFRNDPQPYDDDGSAGHGTLTASIMGATADNDSGIAGVSWDVTIAPLKMIGSSGAAANAIAYSAAMGMPITSNSWGSYYDYPWIKDAVECACDSGQVFVAAAGNDGKNNDTDPIYPASYNFDCVISVAMTDNDDNLVGWVGNNRCDGSADTSNYGATTVDVAAPGKKIWHALLGGGYDYGTCGTSAAAPIVAAAAALLLAQDSTRTAAQIKARILDTADWHTSLDGKMVSDGRLDLENALDNIAPEDIDDLDPWIVSRTAIYSDWTAPGDDTTSGTAEEYDFRYSESIITEANFSSADRSTVDDPSAAGSTDDESVSGLDECTWHYFAIKTDDDAFNTSGMSNVDSLKTLCGGGPPPKVAGPITDSSRRGIAAANASPQSSVVLGSDSQQGGTTVTIVESTFDDQAGTWSVLIRLVPASTVDNDVDQSAVIVQTLDGSDSWITRTQFTGAQNESHLGMSKFFDQSRMILPSAYDVESITETFQLGSDVYILDSADHSRYENVELSDVAMVSGDSLLLVYESASQLTAEAPEPWFVVLERTSSASLLSEDIQGNPNQPYRFNLGAARPNPTTGKVNISYSLANNTKVSINVYNVAGRLVRTLVNGSQSPGEYDVVWDGQDSAGRRISAGVYFYRMQAGDWRSQKKVVFLDR